MEIMGCEKIEAVTGNASRRKIACADFPGFTGNKKAENKKKNRKPAAPIERKTLRDAGESQNNKENGPQEGAKTKPLI